LPDPRPPAQYRARRRNLGSAQHLIDFIPRARGFMLQLTQYGLWLCAVANPQMVRSRKIVSVSGCIPLFPSRRRSHPTALQTPHLPIPFSTVFAR
jgi:hypothetical protein